MKKAILFIVGMLGLVSCYRNGGEENENPANTPEYFKSEVVGTWRKAEYVIYDGNDRTTILDYGLLEDCETNNAYHFANDDTYNEHRFEKNSDGTCSDKGELLGLYEYNPDTKKVSMRQNDGTRSELNLISVTYGEIRVLTNQTVDHNGDGVNDVYVIIYKRGA